MERKMNFIQVTGSPDFLSADHGDRRFWPVDGELKRIGSVSALDSWVLKSFVTDAVDVSKDRLHIEIQPWQQVVWKDVVTSYIGNMKREAKAIRKADGTKHADALEQVAKANGYASWRAVIIAARRAGLGRLTPPIGTPGTLPHGGNSTPAPAPVAAQNQSPEISPVSVE